MTTITTRAGKGSALTHNEMDTNFTNLNTAKLETFTLAGNVSGSLASNVLTINLSAAQTNITSVGTLTGLTLSGTLNGTTVQAATIGNTGATLTGTVSTAAQPNITSVGNLTALTVSGNVSAVNIDLVAFDETVANLTYAATITPNVANATIQTVTLTGNVTLNAFENVRTGQSLTLIIKQDGTGSRILSSTMKWAGNTKTLSTAASSVDIASIFYDGTNYWASLNKGFA